MLFHFWHESIFILSGSGDVDVLEFRRLSDLLLVASSQGNGIILGLDTADELHQLAFVHARFDVVDEVSVTKDNSSELIVSSAYAVRSLNHFSLVLERSCGDETDRVVEASVVQASQCYHWSVCNEYPVAALEALVEVP